MIPSTTGAQVSSRPQGVCLDGAPLIAGGELRWFNPKRLLRVSFRNHRKLLRADGEAGIMLGERSDVPVSRWVSERLFTRFLRAGLRIHCYRPQIVHAKALVLDDVVCVGSSNLDGHSLRSLR